MVVVLAAPRVVRAVGADGVVVKHVQLVLQPLLSVFHHTYASEEHEHDATAGQVTLMVGRTVVLLNWTSFSALQAQKSQPYWSYCQTTTEPGLQLCRSGWWG